MTGLRIAALDLSLSATGVAVTSALARTAPVAMPNTTRPAGVATIRTGDMTGHLRLDNILIRLACLHLAHAQLIVIERPFDNPKTPGVNLQLAGLHALTTQWLWSADVPYVYVSPSTVKVYAVGRGRGDGTDKKAILAKVRTTYADAVPFIDNDNEADALALLAMACDAYGQPLAPVPATHRRAVKTVDWPALRPPRPDAYVFETPAGGAGRRPAAGRDQQGDATHA